MSTAAELVERALALSSADGCIVLVHDRTEVNLRWAANSLTTNGHMHSRAVTVISTIAGTGDAGTGDAATSDAGISEAGIGDAGEPTVSAGVVTRTIADISEVDAVLLASEAAARTAGPADDVAALIEPTANDSDFQAEPAGTGIGVFADFAIALGTAFADARSDGRLLYGFAEHIVTTTYLGSSTGLRHRFVQPTGRLELNAKSADLTRSAWAGVQTRDFSDVDVAAEISSLTQRLEWARTRIDLPAGRYETLLPPTAVADLMIYAFWAGSARDAEEGRTVFSGADGGTRIGDRLAALDLTLRSDPSEPGLECLPFDVATASAGGMQSVFDNGAPLEPTNWITDGVLTDLIRSRAWAQRTRRTARPAIDNLILDGPGTSSLEEMIASTARGLLLTCLWYIREVDPRTLLLTGLTRDGVYLIEDGKVVGAVNNFRFNESPVSLLGRVTEVGQTRTTLPREWNDYFTRAKMPPLRIPDFNMSTVSQAS